MPARNRVLDTTVEEYGSVTDASHNVISWSRGYTGSYRSMYDVTGNRDGFNNLRLKVITKDSSWLNGVHRNAAGDVDMYFNKYGLGSNVFREPNPEIAMYAMTPLRLNAYALKLLANTSPERSEVNVPQFLAEFKDLPGMIRNWGNSLRRGHGSIEQIANANLTWRWALAPLVNDLRSLLNIKEAVDNRFQDLNRMKKGVSLGRKRMLDTGQKIEAYEHYRVHSQHISLYGLITDQYTQKVWGTVQWYAPSWSPIAKSNDADLMVRAKEMVLGMTSRGAVEALWELVPWSWLADWFGNAGDIISAYSNTSDMAYRGLCIMQHLKAKRSIVVEQGPLTSNGYELTCGPTTFVHELKQRFVVPMPIPFPSLRLPILTNSKLSIIGSLAVLRLPENVRRGFRSL